MIRTVGLIYQDVYSLGLLEGLKDRLGCTAKVVSPPSNLGSTQLMTRKQKQVACQHFLRKGVDLVVRFTDADRSRWQEVRRCELKGFSAAFQGRVICGVAVNNPEEWLSLDPEYLRSTLAVDLCAVGDAARPGVIKNAIGHARRETNGAKEPTKDVVRRLVAEAPGDVFKQWLQDDAFRQFYQDCRGIAMRLGCQPEPTNEL